MYSESKVLSNDSIQYFKKLENLTGKDNLNACLEINSNNPTNTLEEIQDNIEKKQRPHPFLSHTVEDIYAFFKDHIRPDMDYAGPRAHFSSFTFLIVDEVCLDSDPWEAQVCCDAPDFGENGEVMSKTLRLPLEEAIYNLCALEMMSLTPSTKNLLLVTNIAVTPSFPLRRVPILATSA